MPPSRVAIAVLRGSALLATLPLLAACIGSDVSTGPDGLRIVTPACSQPAPFEGTYDPRATIYIVELRQGINAATEGARMATAYAFTLNASSGPEQPSPYFSASMTPETVARVRCEATVIRVRLELSVAP